MAGLDFSLIIGKAQDMVKMADPGCLVTIPAPTGTGKTYGIIHYISQQVVNTIDARFFFVTMKKNNLNINDFRNTIACEYEQQNGKFKTSGAREAYLHRTIAVLRSLDEATGEVIASQLPPELSAAEDINRAVAELRIYQERYRQQPEKQSVTGRNDFQNLNRAYTKFKQALIKVMAQVLNLSSPLTKENQVALENYVTTDKSELAHYLNRYFPEINLKKYRLVLTTWAKFMRTVPSFYDQRPILVTGARCLGNATLILDEVDEMKTQMVEKIIDDAMKVPVDFLSLFREISSGVNNVQKKRPESVMSVLRQNHKFSRLKQQVNRLAAQYELIEDYKTTDAVSATNFIFNLDSLTVSSSHPWWSRRDVQGKRVVLSQKYVAEDDLKFYHMIQSMSQFFSSFIQLLVEWADTYSQRVNQQRVDIENQLELEDAVYTICDCLWLSADSKRLVIGLYRQATLGFRKTVKLTTDGQSGHYLQQNGLQLISLTDSDAHLNRTQISAALVQETPEKFLIRLARRGIVVGMSATVKIDTVIKNFDFKFIREQLGPRLIDGLDELPMSVQNQFDISRRCREKGVKVAVVEVPQKSPAYENGDCMCKLIQECWPTFKIGPKQSQTLWMLERLVKQEMADIRSTYPDRNDRGLVAFVQKRYLDLFMSFVLFLGDSEKTTFLGLQGVLTKSAGEKDEIQMSQEFVTQVFTLLSQLLCANEKNQPQLCLIAKKLSVEKLSVPNQISAALNLPAEEETRIYLLSAYATLGVGQNLQHKIGTLEIGKTIDVASNDADPNDPRCQTVDLAGIYLGQVTNVFTQFPQTTTEKNKSQWIRAFYELLSLVDNREVSLLDIDQYANKQSRGIPAKQFRQTISYVGAHTQIILQALGRMDRSFNKLSEITVILGTDVRNYFNVSTMADYQLGPEAQAIRNLQRAEADPVLTSERIRRERWHNRTCETQHEVNKMIGKLQTDSVVAKKFQTYRQSVLRYPTPTFQQYHRLEKKPEGAYLDCVTTAYRVNRSGETFTFYGDDRDTQEISAEVAGLLILLKYPGMQAYFEKNGWAMTWVQTGYVVNPVQFDSYLGILGEVAGQFILENRWSVKLSALVARENELFDFQTANHVYVDFKNWRHPHSGNALAERRHVQGKLDCIADSERDGRKRVLIVNLIESAGDQDFVPRQTRNGQIMEIPWLLDEQGKFALTLEQERNVGEFLNGR
ncbi:hypothetical protein [Levilactobacillus fujinensis]|uniref:Helicase/UvrB N-terminal domain-containing protein n=1 Tax=Levilactobacillus fujinensis TaxID=2486024 RepID=A0ABW1TEP8_9LACO|nr:hypothetical protein [Levilactobacillus fujinensis]